MSDTERAIDRVRVGDPDPVDVVCLLRARGEDLEALGTAAAATRDAGLAEAGRPGVVTYSPKVFVPITRMCRDRCHYCTFVASPHALSRRGESLYLTPDQVLAVCRQGADLGCLEALFTLGDRPEDRWPEARAWLDAHGHDSTLSYVRELAELVTAETGLLVHLNPGVMSLEEMLMLRPVAASMGMMLETTSHRLYEQRGLPHFGSPDKDPAVRLQVLEDAGRAAIPFTSGLLVGIGETVEERADTILALRDVAGRYGGLQEIIVQNFRAKEQTAMRAVADLGLEDYLACIAVTRLLLGGRAHIQAPPNLVSLEECRQLLRAGIDDWGGVSPLTPDHVNPERPWPDLATLASLSAEEGFELVARLTVQPEYVADADRWLDGSQSSILRGYAIPEGQLRGLARTDVHRQGQRRRSAEVTTEAAGLRLR